MRREPLQSRELGGADPLDTELGVPQQSLLERAGLGSLLPLLRTRAALGLRPALAPAVVLLPAGFLLGPRMLGAISFETLGYLDTVVTVALAVLGVFVGIAFGPHLHTAKRLVVASSVEALVTIAMVAGATMFLLSGASLPSGVSAALLALCMGVCAAASSASSADPAGEPGARAASLVADLDDVVPIVLSGMVLMLTGGVGPASELRSMLAAPAIGLAIGAAGWLLFERAESQAERGALLLGSVALLGGAPAYLAASPILAGFTAGLFWTLAPGRADRIVAGDLRKVQHPLVVLLLLTAGAMCVPSFAVLWLVGPYVLFRIAGKLAGGWLAARVSGLHGAVHAFELGVHLIPPGVIGVAFAIGFMPILAGPMASMLITAVALGSIVCEVAAWWVIPPGGERR
jgi:hypothetical protein